jgi:hypothetical protein
VVLPIGGVIWLARRLNRLGKPQDGATSA